MPGASTPAQQQERDQFAASNPPAAAAPAGADAAPKDQTPKADGQVAELTGQKTEQAGPASAAPAPAAGSGGAAPVAAGAAPTGAGATPGDQGATGASAGGAPAGGDAGAASGGAAGGGSAPAAPQKYTFSIGGTSVTIADDGSQASLEVPPTKLWSAFGAGPATVPLANCIIPVPALPIVQFTAKASANYHFQIGDGNLTGASVSKNGSKYTITAGLQTGLSCGFGIGVSAGVQGSIWLVSAGAGISGTAQVGGQAPITSSFSVQYDSATGQLSGAANIATGRLTLPITAQISAFVYGEVLGGIFGGWKKSWPLMSANLGSLVIGASQASFTYANGQAAFVGGPPTFGYSGEGADLSFMGNRS